MASLRELRKRLRSIRSTQQLADAMRTAATAKYAKVNRIRADFGPYAAACRDILALMDPSGIVRETDSVEKRDAVVVFSGNRGLCGGFNAELLRFLDEELSGMNDPLLLVCGKKAAARLREQGWVFEEFLLPDAPVYPDIKPLLNRVQALYVSGQVERVFAVYQHYKNTLTQIPALLRLLPEAEDSLVRDKVSPLFFPDRETVGTQLAVSCLEAQVFELALENASGAQAATLVAMRSAGDNASSTAAELETIINRRRQAEVTASVIETASGNQQQGD